MEKSRHLRGGNIITYTRVGVALGLAALASAGVRILAKNKRTPPEHGGWALLTFTEQDTELDTDS